MFLILLRIPLTKKIKTYKFTSFLPKLTDILSDTRSYKPTDSDATDKFTRETRKELEVLKTERRITPQMYKMFYPKGCADPKFYCLPKIYKN